MSITDIRKLQHNVVLEEYITALTALEIVIKQSKSPFIRADLSKTYKIIKARQDLYLKTGPTR